MVPATSSAVKDIPMHVANIITSSCFGVRSPICDCMIRRIALVEDEFLMSVANSVFSSVSSIVRASTFDASVPSRDSTVVTLLTPPPCVDSSVESFSPPSAYSSPLCPSPGRYDAACVSSPRKNGCPSEMRMICRMADSSNGPSACHLTNARDSSLLRF